MTMLEMYPRDDALVSLRLGTGNQFPGIPADHPSCCELQVLQVVVPLS